MTRPVSLIQANIRAVRGQLGELRPQLKGVQTRLANRWSGFKRTLVSGLPTAITGGLGVATLYKLEVSSPGVLESIQAAGKSVLLYDDIVPALLGAGPGAGIGILLAFTISKVLTVFAQKKEARLADEMGRLEIEQRSLEIELKEAEEEAAKAQPPIANSSEKGRVTIPPATARGELRDLLYHTAPLGYSDIAGFRIVALLGEGAFGQVLKGEAEQMGVKRRAAIKLIKAIKEDSLQRVVNEIKIALMLADHPNIVKLMDFGRIQTGFPDEKLVQIFEFFDALDMSKYLFYSAKDRSDENTVWINNNTQFMLVDPAISIMEDCFEGLYYAYYNAKDKNGNPLRILHRDIKPDNILLSRKATGGYHVKLNDFGLAITPDMIKQNLTSPEIAIGTPLYMSPEQLRKQDLTFSSDLYSLAATFYILITGEYSFARETNEDGKPINLDSWYEVPDIKRVKHLEDKYSSNKIIELDRFFKRALAEKVADRHQVPQDFIRELKRIAKMR